MSALIMMYVFFDSKGDIKAITPNPDSVFEGFSSATFPLAEVEDFLKGIKNPFNYSVKKTVHLEGYSFKLVKKDFKVVVTRSLDSYLTPVSSITTGTKPALLITTDVMENTISLDLNINHDELIDGEDHASAFAGNTPVNLYFTKKNNPYHLLHSIMFIPSILQQEIHAKFHYSPEIDLSKSSVYTRKLIGSYGYRIKGKRYGI